MGFGVLFVSISCSEEAPEDGNNFEGVRNIPNEVCAKFCNAWFENTMVEVHEQTWRLGTP